MGIVFSHAVAASVYYFRYFTRERNVTRPLLEVNENKCDLFITDYDLCEPPLPRWSECSLNMDAPSTFTEALMPILDSTNLSELRAAIKVTFSRCVLNPTEIKVFLLDPLTNNMVDDTCCDIPKNGFISELLSQKRKSFLTVPSNQDGIKELLGSQHNNQSNSSVLLFPIPQRGTLRSVGLVLVVSSSGSISSIDPRRVELCLKQISVTYEVVKFGHNRNNEPDVSSVLSLIHLCGDLNDQDAPKLEIKVVRFLQEHTNAESGFLLLVVPETQMLFCQAVDNTVLQEEIRFAGPTSCFAEALETKQPITLEDIHPDRRHEIEKIIRKQVHSLLCVPVCISDSKDLLALACLVNKSHWGQFNQGDIDIVRQCFKYTATVLTSTLAFQNERKLKNQTQALLQVAKKLFTRLGPAVMRSVHKVTDDATAQSGVKKDGHNLSENLACGSQPGEDWEFRMRQQETSRSQRRGPQQSSFLTSSKNIVSSVPGTPQNPDHHQCHWSSSTGGVSFANTLCHVNTSNAFVMLPLSALQCNQHHHHCPTQDFPQKHTKSNESQCSREFHLTPDVSQNTFVLYMSNGNDSDTSEEYSTPRTSPPKHQPHHSANLNMKRLQTKADKSYQTATDTLADKTLCNNIPGVSSEQTKYQGTIDQKMKTRGRNMHTPVVKNMEPLPLLPNITDQPTSEISVETDMLVPQSNGFPQPNNLRGQAASQQETKDILHKLKVMTFFFENLDEFSYLFDFSGQTCSLNSELAVENLFAFQSAYADVSIAVKGAERGPFGDVNVSSVQYNASKNIREHKNSPTNVSSSTQLVDMRHSSTFQSKIKSKNTSEKAEKGCLDSKLREALRTRSIATQPVMNTSSDINSNSDTDRASFDASQSFPRGELPCQRLNKTDHDSRKSSNDSVCFSNTISTMTASCNTLDVDSSFTDKLYRPSGDQVCTSTQLKRSTSSVRSWAYSGSWNKHDDRIRLENLGSTPTDESSFMSCDAQSYISYQNLSELSQMSGHIPGVDIVSDSDSFHSLSDEDDEVWIDADDGEEDMVVSCGAADCIDWQDIDTELWTDCSSFEEHGNTASSGNFTTEALYNIDCRNSSEPREDRDSHHIVKRYKVPKKVFLKNPAYVVSQFGKKVTSLNLIPETLRKIEYDDDTLLDVGEQFYEFNETSEQSIGTKSNAEVFDDVKCECEGDAGSTRGGACKPSNRFSFGNVSLQGRGDQFIEKDIISNQPSSRPYETGQGLHLQLHCPLGICGHLDTPSKDRKFQPHWKHPVGDNEINTTISFSLFPDASASVVDVSLENSRVSALRLVDPEFSHDVQLSTLVCDMGDSGSQQSLVGNTPTRSCPETEGATFDHAYSAGPDKMASHYEYTKAYKSEDCHGIKEKLHNVLLELTAKFERVSYFGDETETLGINLGGGDVCEHDIHRYSISVEKEVDKIVDSYQVIGQDVYANNVSVEKEVDTTVDSVKIFGHNAPRNNINVKKEVDRTSDMTKVVERDINEYIIDVEKEVDRTLDSSSSGCEQDVHSNNVSVENKVSKLTSVLDETEKELTRPVSISLSTFVPEDTDEKASTAASNSNPNSVFNNDDDKFSSTMISDLVNDEKLTNNITVINTSKLDIISEIRNIEDLNLSGCLDLAALFVKSDVGSIENVKAAALIDKTDDHVDDSVQPGLHEDFCSGTNVHQNHGALSMLDICTGGNMQDNLRQHERTQEYTRNIEFQEETIYLCEPLEVNHEDVVYQCEPLEVNHEDAAYPCEPLEVNHEDAAYPCEPLEVNHEDAAYPCEPLEVNKEEAVYQCEPLEVNQEGAVYPCEPLEVNKEEAVYQCEPLEVNQEEAVYQCEPLEVNREEAVYPCEPLEVNQEGAVYPCEPLEVNQEGAVYPFEPLEVNQQGVVYPCEPLEVNQEEAVYQCEPLQVNKEGAVYPHEPLEVNQEGAVYPFEPLEVNQEGAVYPCEPLEVNQEGAVYPCEPLEVNQEGAVYPFEPLEVNQQGVVYPCEPLEVNQEEAVYQCEPLQVNKEGAVYPHEPLEVNQEGAVYPFEPLEVNQEGAVYPCEPLEVNKKEAVYPCEPLEVNQEGAVYPCEPLEVNQEEVVYPCETEMNQENIIYQCETKVNQGDIIYPRETDVNQEDIIYPYEPLEVNQEDIIYRCEPLEVNQNEDIYSCETEVNQEDVIYPCETKVNQEDIIYPYETLEVNQEDIIYPYETLEVNQEDIIYPCEMLEVNQENTIFPYEQLEVNKEETIYPCEPLEVNQEHIIYSCETFKVNQEETIYPCETELNKEETIFPCEKLEANQIKIICQLVPSEETQKQRIVKREVKVCDNEQIIASLAPSNALLKQWETQDSSKNLLTPQQVEENIGSLRSVMGTHDNRQTTIPYEKPMRDLPTVNTDLIRVEPEVFAECSVKHIQYFHSQAVSQNVNGFVDENFQVSQHDCYENLLEVTEDLSDEVVLTERLVTEITNDSCYVLKTILSEEEEIEGKETIKEVSDQKQSEKEIENDKDATNYEAMFKEKVEDKIKDEEVYEEEVKDEKLDEEELRHDIDEEELKHGIDEEEMKDEKVNGDELKDNVDEEELKHEVDEEIKHDNKVDEEQMKDDKVDEEIKHDNKVDEEQMKDDKVDEEMKHDNKVDEEQMKDDKVNEEMKHDEEDEEEMKEENVDEEEIKDEKVAEEEMKEEQGEEERKHNKVDEEEIKHDKVNEEEIKEEKVDEEEIKVDKLDEEELKDVKADEEEMKEEKVGEEERKHNKVDEEEIKHNKVNEEEIKEEKVDKEEIKVDKLDEEEMKDEKVDEEIKNDKVDEEEIKGNKVDEEIKDDKVRKEEMKVEQTFEEIFKLANEEHIEEEQEKCEEIEYEETTISKDGKIVIDKLEPKGGNQEEKLEDEIETDDAVDEEVCEGEIEYQEQEICHRKIEDTGEFCSWKNKFDKLEVDKKEIDDDDQDVLEGGIEDEEQKVFETELKDEEWEVYEREIEEEQEVYEREIEDKEQEVYEREIDDEEQEVYEREIDDEEQEVYEREIEDDEQEVYETEIEDEEHEVYEREIEDEEQEVYEREIEDEDQEVYEREDEQEVLEREIEDEEQKEYKNKIEVCDTNLAELCGTDLAEVCEADVVDDTDLVDVCYIEEVYSIDLAEVYDTEEVCDTSLAEVCDSCLAEVCDTSLAKVCGTDLATVCDTNLVEVYSTGTDLVEVCDADLAEVCDTDLEEVSDIDRAEVCDAYLVQVCGTHLAQVCGTDQVDAYNTDLVEVCNTDLAEVYGTDLAEVCDTDLVEICGTNLTEDCVSDLAKVCDTGLAEVCNIGVAEVCDTNLAEDCDSDLAKVCDTDLVEVFDTDVTEYRGSDLAKVCDTNLAEVCDIDLVELCDIGLVDDHSSDSTKVCKIDLAAVCHNDLSTFYDTPEVTETDLIEVYDYTKVCDIDLTEVYGTDVCDTNLANICDTDLTEVCDAKEACDTDMAVICDTHLAEVCDSHHAEVCDAEEGSETALAEVCDTIEACATDLAENCHADNLNACTDVVKVCDTTEICDPDLVEVCDINLAKVCDTILTEVFDSTEVCDTHIVENCDTYLMEVCNPGENLTEVCGTDLAEVCDTKELCKTDLEVVCDTDLAEVYDTDLTKVWDTSLTVACDTTEVCDTDLVDDHDTYLADACSIDIDDDDDQNVFEGEIEDEEQEVYEREIEDEEQEVYEREIEDVEQEVYEREIEDEEQEVYEREIEDEEQEVYEREIEDEEQEVYEREIEDEEQEVYGREIKYKEYEVYEREIEDEKQKVYESKMEVCDTNLTELLDTDLIEVCDTDLAEVCDTEKVCDTHLVVICDTHKTEVYDAEECCDTDLAEVCYSTEACATDLAEGCHTDSLNAYADLVKVCNTTEVCDTDLAEVCKTYLTKVCFTKVWDAGQAIACDTTEVCDTDLTKVCFTKVWDAGQAIACDTTEVCDTDLTKVCFTKVWDAGQAIACDITEVCDTDLTKVCFTKVWDTGLALACDTTVVRDTDLADACDTNLEEVYDIDFADAGYIDLAKMCDTEEACSTDLVDGCDTHLTETCDIDLEQVCNIDLADGHYSDLAEECDTEEVCDTDMIQVYDTTEVCDTDMLEYCDTYLENICDTDLAKVFDTDLTEGCDTHCDINLTDVCDPNLVDISYTEEVCNTNLVETWEADLAGVCGTEEVCETDLAEVCDTAKLCDTDLAEVCCTEEVCNIILAEILEAGLAEVYGIEKVCDTVLTKVCDINLAEVYGTDPTEVSGKYLAEIYSTSVEDTDLAEVYDNNLEDFCDNNLENVCDDLAEMSSVLLQYIPNTCESPEIKMDSGFVEVAAYRQSVCAIVEEDLSANVGGSVTNECSCLNHHKNNDHCTQDNEYPLMDELSGENHHLNMLNTPVVCLDDHAGKAKLNIEYLTRHVAEVKVIDHILDDSMAQDYDEDLLNMMKDDATNDSMVDIPFGIVNFHGTTSEIYDGVLGTAAQSSQINVTEIQAQLKLNVTGITQSSAAVEDNFEQSCLPEAHSRIMPERFGAVARHFENKFAIDSAANKELHHTEMILSKDATDCHFSGEQEVRSTTDMKLKPTESKFMKSKTIKMDTGIHTAALKLNANATEHAGSDAIDGSACVEFSENQVTKTITSDFPRTKLHFEMKGILQINEENKINEVENNVVFLSSLLGNGEINLVTETCLGTILDQPSLDMCPTEKGTRDMFVVSKAIEDSVHDFESLVSTFEDGAQLSKVVQGMDKDPTHGVGNLSCGHDCDHRHTVVPYTVSLPIKLDDVGVRTTKTQMNMKQEIFISEVQMPVLNAGRVVDALPVVTTECLLRNEPKTNVTETLNRMEASRIILEPILSGKDTDLSKSSESSLSFMTEFEESNLSSEDGAWDADVSSFDATFLAPTSSERARVRQFMKYQMLAQNITHRRIARSLLDLETFQSVFELTDSDSSQSEVNSSNVALGVGQGNDSAVVAPIKMKIQKVDLSEICSQSRLSNVKEGPSQIYVDVKIRKDVPLKACSVTQELHEETKDVIPRDRYSSLISPQNEIDRSSISESLPKLTICSQITDSLDITSGHINIIQALPIPRKEPLDLSSLDRYDHCNISERAIFSDKHRETEIVKISPDMKLKHSESDTAGSSYTNEQSVIEESDNEFSNTQSEHVHERSMVIPSVDLTRKSNNLWLPCFEEVHKMQQEGNKGTDARIHESFFLDSIHSDVIDNTGNQTMRFEETDSGCDSELTSLEISYEPFLATSKILGSSNSSMLSVIIEESNECGELQDVEKLNQDTSSFKYDSPSLSFSDLNNENEECRFENNLGNDKWHGSSDLEGGVIFTDGNRSKINLNFTPVREQCVQSSHSTYMEDSVARESTHFPDNLQYAEPEFQSLGSEHEQFYGINDIDFPVNIISQCRQERNMVEHHSVRSEVEAEIEDKKHETDYDESELQIEVNICLEVDMSCETNCSSHEQDMLRARSENLQSPKDFCPERFGISCESFTGDENSLEISAQRKSSCENHEQVFGPTIDKLLRKENCEFNDSQATECQLGSHMKFPLAQEHLSGGNERSETHNQPMTYDGCPHKVLLPWLEDVCSHGYKEESKHKIEKLGNSQSCFSVMSKPRELLGSSSLYNEQMNVDDIKTNRTCLYDVNMDEVSNANHDDADLEVKELLGNLRGLDRQLFSFDTDETGNISERNHLKDDKDNTDKSDDDDDLNASSEAYSDGMEILGSSDELLGGEDSGGSISDPDILNHTSSTISDMSVLQGLIGQITNSLERKHQVLSLDMKHRSDQTCKKNLSDIASPISCGTCPLYKKSASVSKPMNISWESVSEDELCVLDQAIGEQDSVLENSRSTSFSHASQDGYLQLGTYVSRENFENDSDNTYCVKDKEDGNCYRDPEECHEISHIEVSHISESNYCAEDEYESSPEKVYVNKHIEDNNIGAGYLSRGNYNKDNRIEDFNDEKECSKGSGDQGWSGVISDELHLIDDDIFGDFNTNNNSENVSDTENEGSSLGLLGESDLCGPDDLFAVSSLSDSDVSIIQTDVCLLDYCSSFPGDSDSSGVSKYKERYNSFFIGNCEPDSKFDPLVEFCREWSLYVTSSKVNATSQSDEDHTVKEQIVEKDTDEIENSQTDTTCDNDVFNECILIDESDEDNVYGTQGVNEHSKNCSLLEDQRKQSCHKCSISDLISLFPINISHCDGGLNNDDLTKLLREIMQEARNLTDAERCSVFLLDKDTDELVAMVFDGITAYDKEVQGEIRLPKAQGIAGHVATTGTLLNIRDAYSHPLFYRGIDDSTGFRTRNILCFPIKDEDDVVFGVAQLCNKKTFQYFTTFDEDVASAFAVYCCISISHSLMYKKVIDIQYRNSLANELMMFHMKSLMYKKLIDTQYRHHLANALLLYTSQKQVPSEEVKKMAETRIPPVTMFNPNFDSFDFSPRTISESQTVMSCLSMFEDLGFVARWRIKIETLVRFLLMVKKGYRNPPYHNWMHAYSVTHFCYLLIKNLHLHNYLEDIELLALFVSCMCHDIDHRGTTNSFQVQSQSVLAALYSSEGSVMERHHLAQSMCILNTEGSNLFENLSSKEYQIVLDLMREIILATDLAHHLRSVKDQERMADRGQYDKNNIKDKHMLLCLLMTACDLSDQTKSWQHTKHIAALVYQEFFSQGDLEKALGKNPLEMMDRERAFIPELQISFLDNVAMPVYKILSRMFPGADSPIKNVEDNRKHWVHIGQLLKLRHGSSTGAMSVEQIISIEEEDDPSIVSQVNGR